MGDIKTGNERDFKTVMQSARRRSLPTLTIPETEGWIQETQVEFYINYFSNPDVNDVPAVWSVVWRFFLRDGRGCC